MNNDSVLLVEDSEDDAFLMHRAFKAAGVLERVVTVTDGEAAIALLSAESLQGRRPRLVLLDLKLPLKSGFDVLSWIRTDVALHTLGVIIVTSSREPADLDRALRGGASAYVVKPSSLPELVELAHAIKAFWLRFDVRAGDPRP